MRWEEKLSKWIGSQIEVHIEDLAGLDPIAPPKKMTLEKIRVTDDQQYIQIYMNEHQFLAIPLHGEAFTRLETSDQGTLFRSIHTASQLVYKVHFGL